MRRGLWRLRARGCGKDSYGEDCYRRDRWNQGSRLHVQKILSGSGSRLREAGPTSVGTVCAGERWVIFATLGILAWVAGTQFATQLIPASRQRLGGGAFLSGTCAVLLALFGLVFRDYHTEHFVTAGLVCLGLGVLVAIPAALLSFLVLRRGFAVDPVMAGLMGGALAGLSGVTLLELHCDNFQALHVLVWHTAVIPVSAAAGALVGRVLRGA